MVEMSDEHGLNLNITAAPEENEGEGEPEQNEHQGTLTPEESEGAGNEGERNGLNASGENPTPNYHERLSRARDAIKSDLGGKVEVIRRRDKQKIIWEVVEEVHPVVPPKERKNIGLKDFDLLRADKETIFADLLLHLSPLPWEQEVQLINEAIRKINATISRAIHEFSPHEYFIGRAILIGAACFCEKGVHLWDDYDADQNSFASISTPPNLSKYMRAHRFKEFRKLLPKIMEDESLLAAQDPWWKFAGYVDKFNKVQVDKITFGLWDLADETMSAFCPRTTKTGGLPNISYIFRKLEPLGTEFKDTTCGVIQGAIKHLEIQRGKMPTREKTYCREMGATAACTLRMCEAGQQEMEEGEKAGIKGDAWFGSVTAADELGSRDMKAVFQVSLTLHIFLL